MQEQKSGWFGAISRTAYNTVKSIFNLGKPIALFTMVLPIQKVGADLVDICFELPGGLFGTFDNTLYCGGVQQNLTAIKAALVACGATFSDSVDDCANFFTNTLSYGSGVLGGTACDWKWHEDADMDICTNTALSKNVVSGYGTAQDIIGTIGFIFAGFVVLGCVAVCAKRMMRHSNGNNITETTPFFDNKGEQSIDKEAEGSNSNRSGYSSIAPRPSSMSVVEQ